MKTIVSSLHGTGRRFHGKVSTGKKGWLSLFLLFKMVVQSQRVTLRAWVSCSYIGKLSQKVTSVIKAYQSCSLFRNVIRLFMLLSVDVSLFAMVACTAEHVVPRTVKCQGFNSEIKRLSSLILPL